MLHKLFLVGFVFVVALSLLVGGGKASGLTRVTGSGLVTDPSGALRVATVSARVMPDGTVKGELEGILTYQPALVIHAKIDCMRFFDAEEGGKGAVLSGWSTQLKNLPPGLPDPLYVVIAVIDAGEGRESEDVFARGIPVASPDFLNCQDEYPLPLIPLEHGNVQVVE
jgi:hypothetical protein